MLETLSLFILAHPILAGLVLYATLFFALGSRRRRILSLVVSLDIFVLALTTLGDSRRNETISACLWSMDQDGRLLGRLFRPAVDLLLSPLESNHCFVSWLVENTGREV